MSLITYLTRIHFADRVLEDALPEELARLGLRRLLIVHDRAAGRGEALDRLVCALPVGCVASPATVTATADDAASWARLGAMARDCDGILGLGGRLALGLALRLGDCTAPDGSGARPVLAVPTTIGCVGIAPMPPGVSTAARAARGRDGAPLPAVVLCDPTLTLHADPAETAAAGMDALVHCIETYLATAWNPPADGIALEGVRRAGRWLRRAVEAPRDLEARREMLAVALNGALAGQKGLGAVHALAHALEAELPAPPAHGSLHAALLRPALRFNAPAVGDRFAALAQALEAPAAGDLGDFLTALGTGIGLPAALGGLGLETAALERVALRAAEDAAARTNPRHATPADFRTLLAEAA